MIRFEKHLPVYLCWFNFVENLTLLCKIIKINKIKIPTALMTRQCRGESIG